MTGFEPEPGDESALFRFERQLFSRSMLRPADFASQRTSHLLSNGLVAMLPYNGIPFYSPLGLTVLDRVERVIAREGERAGFWRVQIPSVMADEDLEAGEPVGEIFAAKITRLSGDLKGHHLLTSPEMLFARLLVAGAVSYRSLPIRHGYTTTLVRQMPTVRGFLTSREFRVYGGVSIDPDPQATQVALERMIDLTQTTLRHWDVELLVKREPDGHFELGYPTEEGDVAIDGRRALSIAIGFRYGAQLDLPLPYRDAANVNRLATMATFAAGSHRMLYAIFDRWRDEHGFALPASVRPADVVVVPKLGRALDDSAALASGLGSRGARAAIDDRIGLGTAQRVAFAEHIGAAAAVLVDRGACSVIVRASGTAVRSKLSATDVLDTIAAATQASH